MRLLGIFDEEQMKFSTVEIRPAGKKRDKWEVRFADLDGDRAIAAHYAGFDFVGCEVDFEYYTAAKERFERSTAQLAMFGA